MYGKPAIDPAALEALAAGAQERRAAAGELPPWERFDPRDKPRYNVAIRLNDYQLTMLRYLAEVRDTSQHKHAAPASHPHPHPHGNWRWRSLSHIESGQVDVT